MRLQAMKWKVCNVLGLNPSHSLWSIPVFPKVCSRGPQSYHRYYVEIIWEVHILQLPFGNPLRLLVM